MWRRWRWRLWHHHHYQQLRDLWRRRHRLRRHRSASVPTNADRSTTESGWVNCRSWRLRTPPRKWPSKRRERRMTTTTTERRLLCRTSLLAETAPREGGGCQCPDRLLHWTTMHTTTTTTSTTTASEGPRLPQKCQKGEGGRRNEIYFLTGPLPCARGLFYRS